MSLDAAVIDALIASGCTAEQLGSAVKASNAEADARAARKRELATARKRREREVKAAGAAMSRDVTRTERDNAGQSVTPPLPDKEAPQTPIEITPLPPQENTPLRGVQKKGCRLPDDFEPDLDWAIAQGLTPAQASIEAAKFADYWRGKSGKDAAKQDWPATWRNWVRQALERLPQARGQPPPKPTLASAFGQVANELRQRNEIRSPAGSDGFQPLVLDLPAVRRG